MPKAPFNISILEPNSYIEQRGCLPTTNHSMFEASSNRFHPDGLFSEVTYGQIGSTERLVKRGYIELRCNVISPHLFKQLISLKAFYKEVLAGKEYAIFDTELKDFVKTSREDPTAETGYTFFTRHLKDVVFQQTSSNKRADKIRLIGKYKDSLFMDKLIVIPAGVRDVKESNGRMTPEEINKYYTAVLSLSQALPQDGGDDPIFDGIRYQIQMKVQTIYTYLANLMDGKGGYAQSKYSARGITYSTRNVITAPTVSRVESPNGVNVFSVDEVMVPIFQAMKSIEPLVINKLKSIFFDQLFNQQSTEVSLINPKTHKLEYVTISPAELRKFTSPDHIKDFINGFRDPHVHDQPVTVKGENGIDYYLYQLHHDAEHNIHLFRNLDDLIAFKNDTSHFSISRVEKLGTSDTNLPENSIIVGDSALSIYGRNIHTGEVDFITPETFSEKLSLKDITYDQLYKESVLVEGYRVIPLLRLLDHYENSDTPSSIKKRKWLYTQIYDPACVKPLTHIEMLTVATYMAIKDKPALATRYPVLNFEGMAPSKVHLTTTTPSCVATLKSLSYDGMAITIPEYPLNGSRVKMSMSPHPATLSKYDGRQNCRREVRSLLFYQQRHQSIV